MYIYLINHHGRQKPGRVTEKRPKKTTIENRQWRHIHVTSAQHHKNPAPSTNNNSFRFSGSKEKAKQTKNSLFRSFSFFMIDRNFLLVNGRFIVSNPFTTVVIVSSSSLLKVACPLIRFGNDHFSLLRSVDREFRNLKQHFSKLLRNAQRERRPALAQR